MNNLSERIRVFTDKNKDHSITPTGGYLIPYEKISHDRFGYPRYLVHYTDLGLRHYSDTIGKITGLKKYRGKTKGTGLYALTSFDLSGDLEKIIQAVEWKNKVESGEV